MYIASYQLGMSRKLGRIFPRRKVAISKDMTEDQEPNVVNMYEYMIRRLDRAIAFVRRRWLQHHVELAVRRAASHNKEHNGTAKLHVEQRVSDILEQRDLNILEQRVLDISEQRKRV